MSEFQYEENQSGLIVSEKEISAQDGLTDLFKEKEPWGPEALSAARFFEREPEEFSFLIDGLLAKGLVGFLYGPGGVYKSLAALWLAVQRSVVNIDASQKWLGVFEILHGKTIFFSAEDQEADLHHRVRDITSDIGRSRSDVPEKAFIDAISKNLLIVSRELWKCDGQLFLIDAEGKATEKLNKIVDLINSFEADLIIIETASRIALAEENDNQLMAMLVSVMEEIRDRTGSTILVVDHSSKVSRFAKTDEMGQNGLRGGGAKMDNARFGLWFRPMPRGENGLDRVEIVNSKSFRCKRADTFTVEVQYPSFTIVKKETEPDIFDAVVEDVKNNPGTKQRETIKRLGKSRTAINTAFKDAITEGVIYQKGPKNKPEGYFYNEE
ncbi:MAG: AAA family ATPase [Chitinispirillaceae bacterium]